MELPGAQEALLARLAATGTKLVLVLVGGSAMAIDPRWKTVRRPWRPFWRPF